ncbi:MAG: endopeptidase La [Gammaproteobacteria bacterium]|nr:endopeptidase La [Gammaproteobacteria bacterium]|tara:strand:- start:1338 stop:3752 length:2415 start_codon:yes stop_codon:yes gene_type:complete
MDIDQQGELVDPPEQAPTGQIILPSEALPGIINVLPQPTRPFFPGQAIPLVMDAEVWLPTLEAVRQRNHDVVGLAATRQDAPERVQAADLYDMGTVCRIHRVHHEGAQLQVLLEGLQRFSVRKWVSEQPPLTANVRYYPTHLEQSREQSEEQKAYAVAIINTIKELLPLNPLFGEELKVFLARSDINQPSLLADFAAGLTSASKEDLQEVLETVPLQRRMERVIELLHREVQIAKAQMEIRQHVEKEIQGHQREAILRQQLKYIQQELGIAKDDKTADLDEFKGRLEHLQVPETARARIDEELQKLSLLEAGSAEYGVTRSYLDWLTSLPWGVHSEDTQDLAAAYRILNSHHEGLEDVKERILEFLALGIMKGDVAGSIICLVGPPGVGKTSLGRSIAHALNRKFYRFSVGGMRDEAEIKGHRRTYIGALPGKLIQALRDTEVANPVIMLDEIDKIGASYQGDPASALLEVLDPEQNSNFHDHYMDVDFDLSKVLFVCTANQLDSIPAPLLDRMEVIHLSGYLDREKLAIARKHLLPRQLKRGGLKKSDLKIEAAALRKIIEGYSREPGVRRLDKALASIVRKAVVRLLQGEDAPIVVGRDDIEDFLGKPLYEKEALQQGVGVVTGLAWTALGGATLPVEATRIHERAAGMRITGQLGDVMQESANIAYSYVRANAAEFGIAEDYFDNANIHLHVPAGATPKDGPSAGVTMATALVSLAGGKRIRSGLAMTGELTLTGKVYPVGGIREKLLAAKRQKIKQVILPAANQRDFEEVPEHIRQGIQVHFADTFDDVVALTLRRPPRK